MPKQKPFNLRDFILNKPEGLRRRYEDLQPARTPRILEVSLTTEERRGRVQSPPPPKKKSSAKVKAPAIIRIVSVKQRVEILLPKRLLSRFEREFGQTFRVVDRTSRKEVARTIDQHFSHNDGELVVILLTETELPLLGVLLHRFAEAQGIIFQEPA